MRASLEQFLEQVARRGSWIGGGSVAALGTALSAALLEKLVVRPPLRRRLQAIRRECLALIDQDATTFARVIEATRTHDRTIFTRALIKATEIPCCVFEHAHAVQAACRKAQRAVKPKFQSDLRCAFAFARAASDSSRALISTNLAWLNSPTYTRTIQRRLASARR